MEAIFQCRWEGEKAGPAAMGLARWGAVVKSEVQPGEVPIAVIPALAP
jgi:hypothetical protein